MDDKQQFRLGLVGYGEIGSTLGQGLRDAGLQQIASYDKYAFDGPYSALIQARAAAAGVTLVSSPEQLVEAADLIVSVTPGSASLESAEAFADGLRVVIHAVEKLRRVELRAFLVARVQKLSKVTPLPVAL